jgi:hypothetical protein
MRVYYAHPITLYDTPQERLDLGALSGLDFDVVNPNSKKHAEGYKAGGMDYFKSIVEGCSALAFRAFPDGSIPAGIFKEIMWAEQEGLIVFELPSGLLRRGLSVEITRETLREGGRR